jgi:hypothetical protein
VPDTGRTVGAAGEVAAISLEGLKRSPAFRQLPIATQASILRDLGTIRRTFAAAAGKAPVAESLVGWRPPIGGPLPSDPNPGTPAPQEPTRPRPGATETIAARAGALSDEIDFPAFVAGLVHGTFDAMVDSSIRQMETYADLVSTVARGLDEFTGDNVSRGQVIDYLSEKHPKDLVREVPLDGSGEPRLLVRQGPGEEDGEEERSPSWLADYDLAEQPLTEELIEQELIPAARQRVGEHRLKSLATMVLLGLNRIVVKDGAISARVRFRAAARDTAKVGYASGQEPGSPGWGERGSTAYAPPSTMVSTVGVNVQADSDLKVELFGEVKINFASETMPLERFADAAQIRLLESHASRSSRRGRNGAADTAPAGSEGIGAPASPPAAPPPAATPSATQPASAVGGAR